MITVIITSCNRLDLLERTLDSFLEMNTHPIKEWFLHNDGPALNLERLMEKYPFIKWQISEKRIGYARSLDLLLAKVQTPWVFNLEDDWWFYQNPGFIEKSLAILGNNQDVHQVWIRDSLDHNHPLLEPMDLLGIKVQQVRHGYRRHWNGYSLNPGLRRMSDLRKFFPNGLAEYGDEIYQAIRTAQFNYRAVALVDSSIKHIGWNRRSINFRA